MIFVFRNLWLPSLSNNSLGQIWPGDLKGSSCDHGRKIHHPRARKVTLDLTCRSQEQSRACRYWDKELIWKHNLDVSVPCLALGQTSFFYLWNILSARLCSWFPFQTKKNWKILGWWLTHGQRGQQVTSVTVGNDKKQVSHTLGILPPSMGSAATTDWNLVPFQSNTGNFTLLTGTITFPYYILYSVQADVKVSNLWIMSLLTQLIFAGIQEL